MPRKSRKAKSLLEAQACLLLIHFLSFIKLDPTDLSVVVRSTATPYAVLRFSRNISLILQILNTLELTYQINYELRASTHIIIEFSVSIYLHLRKHSTNLMRVLALLVNTLVVDFIDLK